MSKEEKKKEQEEAPKTESPLMKYAREQRAKVKESAGKPKAFGADLKGAAKEAIENDKKKKEEGAQD